MRARAKANRGSALDPVWLTLGNTPVSEFPIKIGTEYVVYGICLWRSVLSLLVEDESGGPNWQPADLFDITDNRVRAEWKFGMFRGQRGLEAIWGYEALLSIDHYEGLIERKPEAMAAFREAKARLE
jgi:hypothetical protein